MIWTPMVCHRGSGDGRDAEQQPQHGPKTRHGRSKARAKTCPVNHPLPIGSTSLESHAGKQGQPRTVSSQAREWGKKGEKRAGQEGQLFHVALGMSLERWQVPACSLLPETPNSCLPSHALCSWYDLPHSPVTIQLLPGRSLWGAEDEVKETGEGKGLQGLGTCQTEGMGGKPTFPGLLLGDGKSTWLWLTSLHAWTWGRASPLRSWGWKRCNLRIKNSPLSRTS